MAVYLIHGGLEISVFHTPPKDRMVSCVIGAIVVILDMPFQVWSIIANISNIN